MSRHDLNASSRQESGQSGVVKVCRFYTRLFNFPLEMLDEGMNWGVGLLLDV